MLPSLSSLGVDNLWLCCAQRTERSYFGAKFLEGLKRDAVPRAAPAGPPPTMTIFCPGASDGEITCGS